MNIAQLLTKGYETLKEENIESYIIDTQLLLCEVLNVEKLFIIMNRELEIEEAKEKEFYKLLALRKSKMPIKYILGFSEFMGLEFQVKEGVLIPRPDTEILVEECIKIINENNLTTVCDVCCGSGAIGISLAYHTNIDKVMLYDISEVALEVTSENIKTIGVQDKAKVYKSDLLKDAIEKELTFDIIVSNPPYIKSSVIPTLMEDVKDFEPYIALCGGDDGLDFYRNITAESKKVLKEKGYLAFEIGHDQKEEVIKILKDEGFINVYSIKDLSANDRVVIGNLP